MDHLIYIWIINRFFEFFGKIVPLCVGSTLLALLGLLVVCSELCEGVAEEKVKSWTRCCKRWMIWSLVLSFFCGISGSFKLNEAEFKTVAVYLIGKEIVQSERGEKIINVIDTKLDGWIKKIEEK